jgi:hypothetical protein
MSHGTRGVDDDVVAPLIARPVAGRTATQALGVVGQSWKEPQWKS